MVPEARRVELEQGTDLHHIIDQVQADAIPRVLERDGAAVAVIVPPSSFDKSFPEPKSKRNQDKLLALAGTWSDLDADRLVAHVYEGRRLSPPSLPIDV